MLQLIRHYSWLAVVLLLSCNAAHYVPASVQYDNHKINTRSSATNELDELLKPYSDSVNRNMGDVIAVAGMTLEKKQPEGTLGNALADAMLAMAKEKYHASVDLAVVNYGGIRLPSIAAGKITRGKIYELSPFDNVLVLLKVNGKVLQQFLDVAANKGGWPCAGLSYQIKNKTAVNIVIGGAPLQADKIYTIAVADYLANGGDNCDMLRPVPQQNNGYLFRDAILDYFHQQQQQGKPITAQLENRVSNAE